MTEQIRGQTEVFEKAKQSIEKELDESMKSWSFSKMLKELKISIKSNSSGQKDAVRFFSRHYLKMTGERHQEVRRWLNNQSGMSVDEIVLVFRTLIFLRKNEPTNVAEKPKVATQPVSGLVRRIIDHTVGDLNSNVGLIVEAGITPDQAYDSDRMQIQSSIKKICASLGITVTFPELETTYGPSLTREDLTEMGFEKTQRKKKV